MQTVVVAEGSDPYGILYKYKRVLNGTLSMDTATTTV